MITIGIITKDRQEFLPATLTALINEECDLFIRDEGKVDIFSNPAVRKLFSVYAERGKPITYLRGPKIGIARARQDIINRTDGEYIGFIDDDVITVSGSFYNLLTVMKERKADWVAGCVIESDYERKGYFKREEVAQPDDYKFLQYMRHEKEEAVRIKQASTSLIIFNRKSLESINGFAGAFSLSAGSDSYVTQMLKKGYLYTGVTAWHLSTSNESWSSDANVETAVNMLLQR